MTLVDTDRAPARPAGEALVVLLGGMAGTGLREAIVAIGPTGTGPFPTWAAILAINVVGAFLLAALVAGLAARGPDQGRRRRLRLLLGTGACGGFTTYSTLAVGLTEWLRDGQAWSAIGYAAATLVLGALASWAGLRLGDRTRTPR